MGQSIAKTNKKDDQDWSEIELLYFPLQLTPSVVYHQSLL